MPAFFVLNGVQANVLKRGYEKGTKLQDFKSERGMTMKKIACIILATALFAMPVYAADIDRTSMSDEELLDIQTRADEETSNSSLEVSAVLSG